MRPLPLELRERVVGAYEKGEGSIRGIAKRFSVSYSATRRWIQRYQASQDIGIRYPKGAEPKIEKKHLTWIKCQMENKPGMSSYELSSQFNAHFDELQVHRSTVLRQMHALGYSYKKKRRSLQSVAGRR